MLTLKINRRTIPRIKPGTEKLKKAIKPDSLPKKELCLYTLTIPAGIQMKQAIRNPESPKKRETGVLTSISVSTGFWELKEYPKSPVKIRASQLKYCIKIGFSKP